MGNLKLRTWRGQSYRSWQGLGWDCVAEVGWRTRSLAERVGNWGVTVLDGPVVKKDYGTIWEGLRSKIFKKKKGIACRQCGLWMVVSRQGQGASGQMAQRLELQSWGVGSRLGKKGRRIILKRQQDTRRTLMMREGKQTAFGGLQESASLGRAWFQDEQDSEGNSWRNWRLQGFYWWWAMIKEFQHSRKECS